MGYLKGGLILDKTIIEKRQFPRVSATFPVFIGPEFLGETVDISETGLKFILQKPLLLSKATAKIEFSPSEHIDTEFKVIWSKQLVQEDKFVYGVCFIRLKEKEVDNLRDLVINSQARNMLEKLDDQIIKDKILTFWQRDLKKYVAGVAKLSKKIDSDEIPKEEAESNFFFLTDEIMQEAEILEKAVPQKIVIKKVKQGFRELVGSWIYKGLIVKRAYEKPRGYSGDHRMLEEIYNNQPISSGIGYHSDKYFLENEYAVAVRNRKDKMKEILADFVKYSNTQTIKILNLACGSCREIKELFLEDKKIIFTLVDQDEEALEYARNLFKDSPSNVKFNFSRQDILSLVNDQGNKNMLGNQNLIYSIGLADYLPDRILKGLMQFCIELLASNGKFIITHKDIEKCHPVSPDWFCDWNFYSRNEKHLVDLVRSIGIRNFDIETIIREKSRRILFLVIINQF